MAFRRPSESEYRISRSPTWMRVGGEAGQVGKERGEVGLAVVGLGSVGAAHRLDVAVGEHGVQLLPLGVGVAGGGHVRPGGEEDEPAGEEPPLLL